MFDTLPIVIEETPAASTDQAAAGLVVVVDPEEAARRVREWADCSGAILAKLVADAMSSVADLPDDLAGDRQIFDLITANARVAAWAAANQARLTALVHARARAEHEAFGLVHPDSAGTGAGTAAGASHGFDDDHFTSSEIAANLSLELGLPLPVAEREVTFGLGLARDEDLRLALAVGRLDVAQARAVVDELTHLADPQVRAPVVAALVTDPHTPGAADVLVKELRPGRQRLWDLPPAELRTIIRREAGRRDPDLAQARAASARAGRHVRYVPRRDGMADLVLHGLAETLAATYQHLNLTAHATKHQHGRQPDIAAASLDELRHDTAVGWLTHGEHGLTITYPDHPTNPVNPTNPTVLRRRPTTIVNITLAATTLLGLDQLPATLHSPAGPITLPADLARHLAHDDQATWRRILCDPATGTATDISPTYRPAPRIADYVKTRDGHRSRFPTSNATHLELDHIQPYRHDDPDSGGPTTAANLASEGQRDHHLKTDRAIHVTGNANGPLTYQGRSGHHHQSWPHQYLDPEQPDDDGPAERPPTTGDPPY